MMRRAVRARLLAHRGFRIEVFDESGAGWRVIIHPPKGGVSVSEVLRNHVPCGLDVLLAEARERIDRRVLGPAPPGETW